MALPGSIIQERYHILRLLGRGGFGAVYLAEDERLRRLVALKEMDTARLDDSDAAVALQLFEREALMLAQLDHPGLTHIWDYFQQDGRAYLVMEYVPGATLRDLLVQQAGALPEEFVLACALQLCDVLGYLHARQPPVIFRDLKPANVMVVPSGEAEVGQRDGSLIGAPPLQPPALSLFLSAPFQVKLIDFGIARLFKANQTSDTLVIGTPGYAPPEQYGQGQTNERSDIYSLGATLYHLLSGQYPGSVPPPPLASVAPAVSPALARVIARATVPDPADRYATIALMRRDLYAIARTRIGADALPATGKTTIRLPPAPVRTPARPRATSPLLPGLIIAVLIVVGLWVAAGPLHQARAPAPPRAAQAPRSATGGPTATPAARTEWLLPGAPGRIAFGQEEDSVAYNLLVARLDGQPPQRMTSAGTDFSPNWSPNGDRLAFARIVVWNKYAAIWVGSSNGRSAEPIVAPNAYARYPAWSPDGKEIAFGLGPDRSGPFRLAIVNIATREIRFPGPERVAWIAWSRQGLLYSARPDPASAQDIFLLDEHGGGTPRNLTNTPDSEEDFPAWSPDGRRIAFVASPPGQANLGLRQIYVMDADGSARTRLTHDLGPHTNPVWSPDGRWIAYLSQATSKDWQVWAMRADGSEPNQLTFGEPQKFYLAWGR